MAIERGCHARTDAGSQPQYYHGPKTPTPKQIQMEAFLALFRLRRNPHRTAPGDVLASAGRRAARKRTKLGSPALSASLSAEGPSSNAQLVELTLPGLPIEILCMIATFMDLPTLCRFGAVCRALHHAALHEVPQRLREVDPLSALAKDVELSLASHFGRQKLVLSLAGRTCARCGIPTLHFFALRCERLCQPCFALGTCSRDCPECRSDDVAEDDDAGSEIDSETGIQVDETPLPTHTDFLSGLLHRAEAHEYDVVERSVALSAFLLDDEDLNDVPEIRAGFLRWLPSREAYNRMLVKWKTVDKLRDAWGERRAAVVLGSPSSSAVAAPRTPTPETAFPVIGRDIRADAYLGFFVVMNNYSFSKKPDYVVAPDEEGKQIAAYYQSEAVESLSRAVALAETGSTILVPRGSLLDVPDPVEVWRVGIKLRGETKAEYRNRVPPPAPIVEKEPELSRWTKLADKLLGRKREAPVKPPPFLMPPPAHIHCPSNAAVILSRPSALENLIISSGGPVDKGLPAEDIPQTTTEDYTAHFPYGRTNQQAVDVVDDDFFSALTIDSAATLRECRITADRGSSLVGRNGAQLDIVGCQFVQARCAGVCLTGSARLAKFKWNVLRGNGTWGLQASRALDKTTILASNVIEQNDLGPFYV